MNEREKQVALREGKLIKKESETDGKKARCSGESDAKEEQKEKEAKDKVKEREKGYEAEIHCVAERGRTFEGEGEEISLT